jgi:dUTP pyrophosphatase
MVEIKLLKLDENATIPTRSHEDDAGYDVASITDATIRPFETKLIKTGIAVEIPKGYEIQVRSRSGLALKQGIFVSNSPGTVDSTYRGEIGVILHNLKPYSQHINIGDRIAQLVIKQVENASWAVVDKLTESERNQDGFGSTGN